MTIEVLEPHGFCAGVTGALRKALALLESNGSDHSNGRTITPCYCLHELVHNELVVNALKAKGMVFVESLDEVPDGSSVLFSAHGVSPSVRREAERKRLKVTDATCPFVTRVHQEARDFAAKGHAVVILGHPDHVEVKGIMGEVADPIVIDACPHPSLDAMSERRTLGVVSQTTMNADDVRTIVEALEKRFRIETMAEVCRATKDRQDAVKAFDGDALLVLGSVQSSNTRRLCEVARCRTFRAGSLDEVRALDLSGIRRLGVTSGASTPEDFFRDVVAYLKGEES